VVVEAGISAVLASKSVNLTAVLFSVVRRQGRQGRLNLFTPYILPRVAR
jgi:hypothetical protein